MIHLGIAALVAMAFLLEPVQGLWPTLVKEALMALALLGAWAYLLWRGVIQGKTWFWVGVALAVGLAWHVFGTGSYVEDGVMFGLYMAWAFMAFLVGRSGHVEAQAIMRGSAWGLWVAAVLTAALMASQYFGGPYTGAWVEGSSTRPWGNLMQPNHAATLVVLGAGVNLAALADDALTTGRARCAWVTLFLLMFGLVLSQSRGGLLQWFWMAFVMVAVRDERQRHRRWIVATSAAILTLLWVLFYWAPWGDVLPAARALTEQAQAGVRTQFWQMMWSASLEHPWGGWGISHLPAAIQWSAMSSPWLGRPIDHAHNQLLDLVIWFGHPVGWLVTFGVLSCFWKGWRGRQGDTRRLAFMLAGALFIHANVEYPLSYSYFLLPFAMLMGMMWPRSERSSEVARPTASLTTTNWLAWTWWFMALCLSMAVLQEYTQQARLELNLRFKAARIGLEKLDLSIPPVRLLDRTSELHQLALLDMREPISPDHLAMADRLVQRQPQAAVLLRHAMIHARVGDPERATTSLLLLCKLHLPGTCKSAETAWTRFRADEAIAGRRAVPPFPSH